MPNKIATFLLCVALSLNLPMIGASIALAAEDCRAQISEVKRHWNGMTPGAKKVKIEYYITTADQALIEQDEDKCLANLAEAKRLLGVQ